MKAPASQLTTPVTLDSHSARFGSAPGFCPGASGGSTPASARCWRIAGSAPEPGSSAGWVRTGVSTARLTVDVADGVGLGLDGGW